MRLKLIDVAFAACLMLAIAPLAAMAQDTNDAFGGRQGGGTHATGHIDNAKAQAAQREFQKKKADLAKKQASDPAAARAAAMALATPMITSAKVGCDLSDAIDLGSAELPGEKGQPKNVIQGVEVACKDTFGYVLFQENSNPAEAHDCMATTFQASPKANPLASYACTLQANRNPLPMIQAYLTKASSGCAPAKAGYLTETDTFYAYEVQCQSGVGQIMQVDKPRTASSKAVAASCLALALKDKPFPCLMTTQEANEAPVKAMAAKASPPCSATKLRYMTGNDRGDAYYELACQGGSGIVMLADANDKLLQSLSCAKAIGLKGGCQYTDSASAMAGAQAEYTEQAKAAGYSCNVSKFASLVLKGGATEAVELVCGAAPGGVLITKDGKTMVYDCARSLAEGYSCLMAANDAANKTLTSLLASKGHGSCVVNGVAPAASASAAFIEVSCSDGAPGFVIKYPKGSNTPSDFWTCHEAESTIGGCKMAANKKT